MKRILHTVNRIFSITMVLITAVSCSGPGSPSGIPTSTQADTPTTTTTFVPTITPTLFKTQTPTLSPTQTPALMPSISAGEYHTCMRTATGGVQCWGDNKYGQLGDGTKIDRLTPVDVIGLTSGVSAISAGNPHTCALTTGGGVKCWGQNNFGQLGDGTTTDSSTPVDVVGLTSGVSAVAAGDLQTCVLTVGGGVKCWGSVGYGLGDGTLTDRHTPVDVIGLSSGVAAITTGGYSSCVLTVSGGVKCWGDNWKGELGDGTTTDRLTPVDVIGLTSGVTAIATNNYTTCALTAGGGVKCWGFIMFDPGYVTTTDSSTPVDVSGLSSGVIAISVGGYFNCALTAGGGVKCWGSNVRGALGDGTTTDSTTPVDVSGLTSGVSVIAAGGGHVCALTSVGEVKC
jgi:alpha-tubulin suppressor-like RCC1 family protein